MSARREILGFDIAREPCYVVDASVLRLSGSGHNDSEHNVIPHRDSSRDSLRLLTWNIHSCRSARMVPSLDRVVDLIDSTEAQIVALQEVDVGCSRTDTVNQAYEIGRRLGMSHFFCCLVQWEEFPHFTEPDGEYGLAFLCHPDLRPHRTHRWELPLERETSEPRGVFQIEIDWQGGPVKILNTHLSVQRRERAMQLRALCEMVEQLNDQEEECVLMGDFNTVGSSRELRTLRRLIPECVSNRSFTPTFPSRFPLFRLDRVFASAHLQCHSCRVLGTPEARLASDHLPVQVEIGR